MYLKGLLRRRIEPSWSHRLRRFSWRFGTLMAPQRFSASELAAKSLFSEKPGILRGMLVELPLAQVSRCGFLQDRIVEHRVRQEASSVLLLERLQPAHLAALEPTVGLRHR